MNREEWQARLDSLYPEGANVTVVTEGDRYADDDPQFVSPRLMVVEMWTDDQPTLVIQPVDGSGKTILFDVASIEDWGEGKNSRVLTSNDDRELIVTAEIGPEAAAEVKRVRTEEPWRVDPEAHVPEPEDE